MFYKKLVKNVKIPYNQIMRSLRKAFTLAEVLITLGIIGVVAAMTISTVANNIKHRELQTAFLKTYSELNQIAKNFYAQEGMSIPNKP